MDSQPLISTKADDLFHLQIMTIKAESELEVLLASLSNPFDWSDFSYDYYDFSLELYGVPDTYKLCGMDATKLKEFGFKKVWVHTVKSKNEYTSATPRKNQGEQFYNL